MYIVLPVGHDRYTQSSFLTAYIGDKGVVRCGYLYCKIVYILSSIATSLLQSIGEGIENVGQGLVLHCYIIMCIYMYMHRHYYIG